MVLDIVRPILILVSIALGVLGTWRYLRDTLRGGTKPNRVTWFMWALAPITASGIAYLSGGEPWSAFRVFTAGFLPLLVFIASFYNPQSYWKLSLFDLICGMLSLAAFLVWIAVSQSAIAIVLALIGDGFASLPTLRKSWLNPETETGTSYIYYAVAFVPSLLAVSVWSIENVAFQIYLLCLNLLLVIIVYRERIARRSA